MGYIYLIQSQKDGSLYFGSTSNLDDRLLRHNSDRSKSTASKAPWLLLKVITCSTIKEARRIEQKMKAQKVKVTLEWFNEWLEKVQS